MSNAQKCSALSKGLHSESLQVERLAVVLDAQHLVEPARRGRVVREGDAMSESAAQADCALRQLPAMPVDIGGEAARIDALVPGLDVGVALLQLVQGALEEPGQVLEGVVQELVPVELRELPLYAQVARAWLLRCCRREVGMAAVDLPGIAEARPAGPAAGVAPSVLTASRTFTATSVKASSSLGQRVTAFPSLGAASSLPSGAEYQSHGRRITGSWWRAACQTHPVGRRP